MNVLGLKSAVLSDCGKYRYSLTRIVGQAPGTVGFIMLNPSIADAVDDDPTIRRCTGFTHRWGYGRFEVVNLFAWRGTDPAALPYVDDPIGVLNNEAIMETAKRCNLIVCAWGTKGRHLRRDLDVLHLLRGFDLHALKITKSGDPGHPLYLPYHLPPVPYGR